MADQHHAATQSTQARHFHMHLGDQRTGGVEHFQATLIGFLAHGLRHAVGAEDHRGTIGYFVQFFDKHGAIGAQLVDHVAVVHHFVTHVDRGAIGFERAFDNGNGAIDTGTKATGIGEQDVHGNSGPKTD